MSKMLVPSVYRSHWKERDAFMAFTTEEELAIKKKVLIKSKCRCHYCGFTSKKFQSVEALDHNIKNLSESNLVAVCPLCRSALHVAAASEENLISLILCPELSQSEINHLMHAIWYWMSLDAEHKDYAKTLYSRLCDREYELEQLYSQGFTNPSLIGGVLRDLPSKLYSARKHYLKDLRVIPKLDSFAKQVEYWNENVYSVIPVEKFQILSDSLTEGV